MESLIEIDRLTKRFGSIVAVDGVSFRIGRGEVLGFLGPNGAGKSTTMRLVAGYLRPDSGSVRVCGLDVMAEPLEARRRMGYLPEGAPLYDDMSPARLLAFTARVRGLDGRERQHAIAAVVERLELRQVLGQPIETLSKGFRRRVGLAQAMLSDPDILILDEPTDGLDPNQKHQVRSILRDMADRKAVVVSTHILEEVDAVCTRAIVIADGRILADETPEALAARGTSGNPMIIRVRPEDAAAGRAALAAIPGATVTREAATAAGTTFRVAGGNGCDLDLRVREMLIANDLFPLEIHHGTGRLDEVFREITTGSDTSGARA